MRRFPILVLAAGLACQHQNPMAPRVDQEFTLILGQQATFADAYLTIRFTGVLADNRCPVDVQCIAAGNAVVQLVSHLGPPQALTPDRLVTLNTDIEPRAAPIAQYSLQLIGLSPVPLAGLPRPGPYRARLRLVVVGNP